MVANYLERKTTKSTVIVFSFLYMFAVFSSGWNCDDAYHSYVMAQNLVNGHGFVYNYGYRVNASTCPFFTLLVALFHLFINDVYLIGIVIGTIFSTLTGFILFRYFCKNNLSVIFAFFSLILCHSYHSFTTSGLENSALYFVVSVIIAIFLHKKCTTKTLFTIFLLSSLLMGFRMDNILIVLPILIFVFINTAANLRTKLLVSAIGMLPFISWELFSLWYFGFPFPNTAYAKLSAGISRLDYFMKGSDYILRSFATDVVLLITITFFLLFTIVKKNIHNNILMLGVLFYLLYIIYIGGDFMAGRHLTVVFLASLLGLLNLHSCIDKSSLQCSTFGQKMQAKTKLLFYVFIIALFVLYDIFAYQFNQKYLYTHNYECDYETSITDEKAFYYKFNVYEYLYKCYFKSSSVSCDELLQRQYRMRNIDSLIAKKGHNKLYFRPFISGMESYNVKKYDYTIYITDYIGLADEFRSRLKTINQKYWRIGHIKRAIPLGYLETLLLKENFIKDKKVRKYYDILHNIVAGDLFDSKRILDIIKINLGYYNWLLEDYEPNNNLLSYGFNCN